jgi:histidine ammonia-lyase
LVADRARCSAVLADLVVAISMEAMRSNLSVTDPAVAAAKPVPGQARSAATIRAFLEGSDRCLQGTAASVQDPLSFRVAPQVHGAAREVIRFFADAVEGELAAADDNPLVSVEGGRLISNGNFHPMLMALAADAVRPAIAHIGLLGDHRTGHVWESQLSDPDMATPEGMKAAAEGTGLLLRYAAAARYTELRALADPITLDVPSLDLGVEDHATNAPLAVRRTDEALDLLEDLVAVEMLAARMVLRKAGPAQRLGCGTSAALDAMEAAIAAVGARPSAAELHGAVRAALPTDILSAAVAASGLELSG